MMPFSGSENDIEWIRSVIPQLQSPDLKEHQHQ